MILRTERVQSYYCVGKGVIVVGTGVSVKVLVGVLVFVKVGDGVKVGEGVNVCV